MNTEIHDIISRARVNRVTIVEFFNEETARTRAQQIRDTLSINPPWTNSIDVQAFGRRVILHRQ